METHLVQLKEYLKLDSEISHEEFAAYYNDVISFLQDNFDCLEKEDSLKGRYIMKIVALNAGDRSKRKDKYAKKFKKTLEKAQLWADAFNYRLLKMGLSQGEIDASHEEFNKSM
ncbi:MAG: hypothetical protein KGZ96_09225 [Clostridia bacterium]|nr:hypothetical protein [Clostridia bacterium]